MSQTMEDLLANQQQIMVAMNQLLSNFKKDGQERKTPDYIKRRLETLDSYWQEFQSNHDQLNPFSNKSIEYFALNHYQQTHGFYLSTRETIKSAGPSILRPATPLAGTSRAGVDGPLKNRNPEESEATTFLETPKFKSQGTNSKLDELLKKQAINFKAFYRTVANINVDAITEKWEFLDTLKTLETRWSAIDTLHWELEGELDGQDDSYEDKFTSYEITYSNMKKSLNSKLWSVSHREHSTPKMEVPTFNGHYQHWVSFKDLFTEAIHNNPSLSQAQKMQFLKAKLKGEAEGLIHHLQISSENYSTCWEILNHRYNNKLLIFTSHMNTLTNLPVMQQPSVYYIKRIHDTTIECVNAIKNMGADVSTWDPVICYLMSNKLDANTHSEYIASLKQPRELPILSDFLDFMEAKFTSMESSRRKQDQKSSNSNAKSAKDNNINNKNVNRNSKQSYSSNKNVSKSNGKFHNKRTCPLCKNSHGLFHCEQYIGLSPIDKKQFVVDNKLCENCLFSHKGKECISTRRCHECDGSHNTILHDAFSQSASTSPNEAIPKAGKTRTLPDQTQQLSTHVAQQRDVPETLLSTAVVKVQKFDGSYLNMRALIDQGSQTSLITENAAQQLGLPRQRCKGIITGIGARDNACKGVININCSSRRESYSFNTDVFIMKTLTKNLPTYTFAKPTWSYLENIELADPDFYVSRPVDILFGADIYSNIIMEGICRLEQTTPIAQQTRLGWILCGNVNILQCNVVQFDIDQFQKFWETEEIAESTSLSSDDQECMQFYSSTTNRLLDGRYVVRLPLKTNFEKQLGNSKSKAIAQFGNLERKLIKNENIAKEYKTFIHEYLALGHMKPAISNTKLECFLPHHCVLRDDSTTTSLRVVFNASSKTSSGQSLNDLMHKGPNLQQDLQSLILKWRQYQFAFTADIEKMFRQILVHNEDQSLQKIVWRDSSRDNIQEYQLTTVTYGTKAAPFLAMMTLKQLANDERSIYPDASKVLEESFYMDDLLHGTHSVSAARQLQQDLIELLKRGGFNLRKWTSNDPHLLHNEVPCQQQSKSFRQPESTKTLGLRWNPVKDNFTFEPKIDSTVNKATKRSVLSDISKFFDPLGWLTPTTTKLKILFQRIWTSQIQWDEQLPEDIFEEWNKLKADIDQIRQVQIPRWLGTKPEQRLELHGFCDSSTKAYACVIYCKVYNKQTSIILVAGKSRIIPANKNISLPRLELCGAHLLSKLMAKVKASLTDYNISIYGWIDSTAVLGWLNGDPGRWQTFVANRTRLITEIMPPACWRYVKSAENPADCASRGLSMSQLIQHPLWWQGPSWLQTFKADEGIEEISYTTTLETKPQKQVNTVTKQTQDDSIIMHLLKSHSSFTKVVHVLAWVYRFLTSKQNDKQSSYLTLEEIRKAKINIIKQVQQQEFAEEIKSLREKGKLSNKSRILNLNPFLDNFGLLRVGGRLRHAHIHADMQHPLIIPQRGRLTELLIEHAHKLTFHGGARLTSGFIRQKYWIVGGNEATKKQIRLCVKCKKLSPNKHNQIMGDLPVARSNPSRPFEHTGIDFTGHLFLKANKGRGIKTTKGYVAVFVCMSTKAVHLELVSDLSTSSFIAALRRMAARRGTPSHIYSDNGRNFVGANKQIQQEYQELQQIFNNKLLAELTDMEINWHFNAPIWPSAGGLWESAVKSFKHHFRRVVGEQKLTFEELSTVLTQIEACLNSRPLCPLTEDPEDLNYLTPSHFLTGGSALTLVETERDLRTRWQLTQKILADIWKRWRSEYLTQLTTRSKWRQSRENINLNDVVLLHDDNLPPGRWSMGRVVDLHPGADGFVRVVSLKTKNGILKRPITKISILPVNQNQSDSSEDVQEELKTIREETKLHRKSKRVSVTILFTSLLFFMTIVTGGHCDFQSTIFRANQSLYFDKLSNMQIIRDEWKLIIYYDMQPYWEGITALNKYTKSLEQSCKTIRNIMNCDIILLQLVQGFSELEYYNQMLLGQHSNEQHARQRRGLIDGVGYLANSLFGVLDARFAEQYRKDITLLRDNQRHIASYWKNQTSIIEVEYNLLKRTEQTMNRQHKMVSQHIFSIEKALNQIQSETQNMSIVNELTVGAIIGSNMLHNLKSLQSTLLDTITDIYHGQFNPHLLTPVQLQDQLSTISSQLPKDVTLPVDNVQMDLRKIYKLLKVKARMLEEYLIFEIRLPLISRDSFEIFKIFSIPQVKGTDMVSIQPISDYVAINLKKDTYLTMTEKTLTSCLISDVYLCHIQRPIYHLNGDKDFCQTEEFECETRISPCKNSWFESNTINNYIYFCCDQCSLRIMCEDQVVSHQLTGAGLVAIDNGCIIKTQAFTLIAHRQHSSQLNIKPDVYAPLIPPINHIINITIPHMIALNDSETDQNQMDLTELGQKIKIMKENAAIAESISVHDIHHYTLIYIIVGIAGIVGLVYAWRRVRAWRVPATPTSELAQGAPAPLPRNNDNPCVILGDRVFYHSVSELNDNNQSSVSNLNSARVNKATSPICVR